MQITPILSCDSPLKKRTHHGNTSPPMIKLTNNVIKFQSWQRHGHQGKVVNKPNEKQTLNKPAKRAMYIYYLWSLDLKLRNSR